jgi:hypothetical protein
MNNNILKLTLKKIDPVKYAIIATLTYLAIMLIIFVPFMLLFSAIGATQDLGGGFAILGGGIFAIIFGLIFYGVIIFIVTLLAGYLLNFILKKTGGLPLEFEKSGMDISQIGQNRIEQ